MDRLALWKALRGIGIPQYLLQLIEDPHNGSTSNVRIGATLSPSFITTSGVSVQGCVLALLCFAVQLTVLWSELPPELVSHWATTTSLTWIMQMTLSSSLTKWMTFILEFFETTASQLGLHMYLGRRLRSRIWVRVNLHLANAYQFAATRWKK